MITPGGREQVFVRGRGRMVLVRDEQASYEMIPATREEAIELARRSETQARAFQHDSPELIFLQEGPGYIELRAQGDLRLYEDAEGILHGGESSVAPIFDFVTMVALDQYPSHPYAVKISAAWNEYWIDLRDDAAELTFKRIDTVPERYNQFRAQVSGQEYDNTSLDFLSALTEALEPQPIGIMHVSGTLTIYFDEELNKALASEDVDPSVPISVYEFSKEKDGAVLIDMGFGRKYWVNTNDSDADFELHLFEDAVATDAPSGYEILPIVPDEIAYGIAHGKESNIEISDPEWADRTGTPNVPRSKIGTLTRDYNHTDPNRINEHFRLQSPVIGPDVRVEVVVEGHYSLGNYLVISFPASVYLSDDTIMSQLEVQGLRAKDPSYERYASLVKHDPSRWHEDGRIFYAFAHLSRIDVEVGEFIDARDKSILGMTGETGRGSHHLDLGIMYCGSKDSGSGAMARELGSLRDLYKSPDPKSVDLYFGLAMRSQLFPFNNVFDLYCENLDSALIHSELDESELAEYELGDSIYVED